MIVGEWWECRKAPSPPPRSTPIGFFTGRALGLTNSITTAWVPCYQFHRRRGGFYFGSSSYFPAFFDFGFITPIFTADICCCGFLFPPHRHSRFYPSCIARGTYVNKRRNCRRTFTFCDSSKFFMILELVFLTADYTLRNTSIFSMQLRPTCSDSFRAAGKASASKHLRKPCTSMLKSPS